MSQSQKQGGKGKSSSPSDLSYWKRISPERQRTKRIARHAKRLLKQDPYYKGMPNALNAAINGCEPKGKISYGHARKPLPLTKTVLSDNIRTTVHFPVHIVISEGVCVEISPRQSDAVARINMLAPSQQYSHELLHDSGRRELISARNVS